MSCSLLSQRLLRAATVVLKITKGMQATLFKAGYLYSIYVLKKIVCILELVSMELYHLAVQYSKGQ